MAFYEARSPGWRQREIKSLRTELGLGQIGATDLIACAAWDSQGKYQAGMRQYMGPGFRVIYD